jgi:hypothetical protein
MWSNIRAGLGPARPNEGTAWFRAGLGHCFYTSGWHGTAQKLFGLSWPEPVWHEARWAWAGPARHGPIPSTTEHNANGFVRWTTDYVKNRMTLNRLSGPTHALGHRIHGEDRSAPLDPLAGKCLVHKCDVHELRVQGHEYRCRDPLSRHKAHFFTRN